MEELEKLPEWAGRKAETRVSKETWSAAELNQPLISLDVETPAELERDPVLSQQTTSETAPVVTIDAGPRRRGRWLFALATLSLIAGVGAGLLYLTLVG